MTTGPDEHGRQQKDRTPTSSPSTLTHETVQWDCLFEIIHPRRKVRVRVRLGEPDPTQEKRNKEMIVSYPSRHKRVNGETHLLMYDCVGKLSGSQV